RARLATWSSSIVLTAPAPDRLEAIGWTGGECITDARATVQYFRTTPDGRIAFGGGGGRVVSARRADGRWDHDPVSIARAEAGLTWSAKPPSAPSGGTAKDAGCRRRWRPSPGSPGRSATTWARSERDPGSLSAAPVD